MSFIDDYCKTFHGAKIELLQGRLVIGDSFENSKTLLLDMMRGWGIEAAIELAPETLWLEALRQQFGMSEGRDYGVLEAWAEQVEYAPELPQRWKSTTPWRYRYKQNLRMAMYGLHREEKLGQTCGHGVVNRIGREDAFMPDDYFYLGSPRNRMFEYYLDGPAEWVVEWVRSGLEDYTLRVKHDRYQAAGVPEVMVLDGATQRAEFWRLVDGVYQVQQPDESGRYPVSSIPGLTVLPERIWGDEDASWPLFGMFEVAADAPRQLEREVYAGEGMDWSVRFKAFPIGLEPVPISFADYLCWSPPAKFEFVNGKPWLGGGEEGGRGMTGMLLMTFGLLEVVRLAHPRDWVRGMRECFVMRQDATRQLEWWKWARDSAVFLKEQYGVDRVAVAGDLVTKGYLGVWSDLVLLIWGLPEEDQRYESVWRAMYAMNPDRAIRILDAAKIGEWSQHYLAQAIDL